MILFNEVHGQFRRILQPNVSRSDIPEWKQRVGIEKIQQKEKNCFSKNVLSLRFAQNPKKPIHTIYVMIKAILNACPVGKEICVRCPCVARDAIP